MKPVLSIEHEQTRAKPLLTLRNSIRKIKADRFIMNVDGNGVCVAV